MRNPIMKTTCLVPWRYDAGISEDTEYTLLYTLGASTVAAPGTLFTNFHSGISTHHFPSLASRVGFVPQDGTEKVLVETLMDPEMIIR